MFVYSILHELHHLNLRLRAICSRLGKKPSESVSSVTVELDCRCDSREAVVEGMETALVSVKWKLQENDVSTLSSDDILYELRRNARFAEEFLIQLSLVMERIKLLDLEECRRKASVGGSQEGRGANVRTLRSVYSYRRKVSAHVQESERQTRTHKKTRA